MSESQRIDELRRRVHTDPTSIAFAQLAEELRRAGALQESVETCRAGLAIHPSYLSARVTLGRALVELGQLDDAESELSFVLSHAPENLSALRGLGEICNRRGLLDQALAHYRAALALAPNDPDLELTVTALLRAIERAASPPEVSFMAEPVGWVHERELRTLAALETWLDAINVARTYRRA
jgi:tetratricopeptide (TPR) repeat protein